MDENVKVSVIIPVYNAEKWLERCATSVTNQTLKEIEIILVDDGSTDNSLAVCQEIATKDSRISVIHCENNGPSTARNIGMGKATGEYIAFVDADDEVKPDMYENMYRIAIQDDAMADVVCCNILIQSKNAHTRINDINLASEYCGNANIIQEILKRFYGGNTNGLYGPCNKLYNRSFLSKHSIIFDKERAKAEDQFFNFYVLKHADLVRSTSEAYYIYHQDNPNSIIHSHRQNQYFEWKRDYLELIEQCSELGLTIDYFEFWVPFLYSTHMHIIRTIWQIPHCKEKVMRIVRDEVFHHALAYENEKIPVSFKISGYLLKGEHYQLAWIYYVLLSKTMTLYTKIRRMGKK